MCFLNPEYFGSFVPNKQYFVNFLDSTIGVNGANGTLALGTKTTNNITIGPTGGYNIKIQSALEFNKQDGTKIINYNRIIYV